jgi:hypothetical protein
MTDIDATGSDGRVIGFGTTSRAVPGGRIVRPGHWRKELTMANMRLLQACGVAAMLAAAPAFAQTNTETGSTGAGGTPNNPTAHEAMPMGTGSHTGMGDHATHRSAMRHSGDRMHGMQSQSATVDQLNEQSYQAARNGQPFSGGPSGGGAMAPGGSGSMNDMSGGSMSGGSNSK